jgi:hypothetical protein
MHKNGMAFNTRIEIGKLRQRALELKDISNVMPIMSHDEEEAR